MTVYNQAGSIRPSNKNSNRIITTGSMQSRFSIAEEVMILQGYEGTINYEAQIIRSRLFNAKYADLDYGELVYGVTVLTDYFLSVGLLDSEDKVSLRRAELLTDGTNSEKYTGTL